MDVPLALQLLVALTSQSSRARCSHLKISVLGKSEKPRLYAHAQILLLSLVQAQKLYPLLDPDLVPCLELVG